MIRLRLYCHLRVMQDIYIHRIGRTARMGKAGVAVTLMLKHEVRHSKSLVRKNTSLSLINYSLDCFRFLRSASATLRCGARHCRAPFQPRRCRPSKATPETRQCHRNPQFPGVTARTDKMYWYYAVSVNLPPCSL